MIALVKTVAPSGSCSLVKVGHSAYYFTTNNIFQCCWTYFQKNLEITNKFKNHFVKNIPYAHRHHYAGSTEETFLQDFLEIISKLLIVVIESQTSYCMDIDTTIINDFYVVDTAYFWMITRQASTLSIIVLKQYVRQYNMSTSENRETKFLIQENKIREMFKYIYTKCKRNEEL